MIALLLTLFATAGEPLQDTLVEAMTEQADSLTLGEDAPPIYHLRYHLVDMDQRDVRASFGHLVSSDDDPYHRLAVELRVGKPEFDNTGFGGWENGFAGTQLPRELTPHALRLAAWRITDTTYKQAVEQFARKEAQFSPPDDYPGDYTLLDAVVHTVDPPTVGERDLEALAETLSAAFAGKPGVELGDVIIGHESGTHTIVDTGGNRVVRPMQETTVRAVLHVRCKDGLLLTDSLLWSVRDPADLPTDAAMRASVDRMTADLLALAEAPVLSEEVVGPVVFTDDAAIDLYRYLLVPQLEGTPPEVPFDSWLGELGSPGSGSVRMGRRVLPPGWSVSDDPAEDLTHPGAFTHDYEGTPTEEVDLVVDGIVRDLAMSRVPRNDLRETNGHARGSLSNRLSGRLVQTTIAAEKAKGSKKLHKRALKLASAYGRDWYLRVERLQDPAVRDSWFDDSDEALPRPVRLVRVHADGREEILRGGRFSGVQRFALRDIVQAGPTVSATFLLPSEPGGSNYTPTGGLPTLLRAPEVVVGELEVLPTPPDSNEAPLLPHPFAAASAR